MALADYIERAATSASQALSGFSVQAFHSALGSHVVGIAFDASGAGTSEGRATLDLVIRTTARLHPVIAIVPIGRGLQKTAIRLAELAISINPAIEIRSDLRSATCCLVVGSTKPKYDGPRWFLGSAGWVAKLESERPVGSGDSTNPFGAGAAACFGAANVFRHIFGSQLEDGRGDASIDLSMLTYGAPAKDAILGDVDLGETRVAGLGAIGNGVTWALARVGGLRGTLHLVDNEVVELSNVQRYVMAARNDVGAVKVDLAKAAFSSSELRIVACRERYSEHLSNMAHARVERVAVALDSAGDRIALQGSLPQWIVNAWTQTSDLGVSRHDFDGSGPCLACLYMPRGATRNEDEIIADELRMPEALMEIRRLLQVGEPIGQAFVERIAHALGLPFQSLIRFADQPLRAFRQAVICGGIALSLSDGRLGAPAVVPMAFQSALAGIMLACDLVKHACGVLDAPTPCTRINLLRPLGSHLNDPMTKDASGRCICADADFLAAYRARHE